MPTRLDVFSNTQPESSASEEKQEVQLDIHSVPQQNIIIK